MAKIFDNPIWRKNKINSKPIIKNLKSNLLLHTLAGLQKQVREPRMLINGHLSSLLFLPSEYLIRATMEEQM
jgi:hypothetical protein